MSSILAMTTLSIAQLVEQRTVVPLVTGSSPVAEICLHGPMDKAPAYGAGDYEFESRRAFTSEMTYFLTLSRVV